MGALSLCSLCECDLGLHLVSLPSALGLFVGSYLRSPATQWCGTWLMPDRKLPWCLLTKYRATCWVTFHISERKGLRCRRTSTGCQRRDPMFPPSLEWAQTAPMAVCARSKDSEICLCLQLVSNSRRETGSHSYSSPCRVVQTLLNLRCSPSSPNLRPVLITNKRPGS